MASWYLWQSLRLEALPPVTARGRARGRRVRSCLDPQQQESGRDGDERPALAEERLPPGEGLPRPEPGAVSVELSVSLRQPARHARGVVPYAWPIRARAAVPPNGRSRGTRGRAATTKTGASQSRRAPIKQSRSRARCCRGRADFARSANGPLATSGPRRSLRVREMAPMWCTPPSRSHSPIQERLPSPPLATTTEGRRGRDQQAAPRSSGRGSHVRCAEQPAAEADAKGV